MANCPYCKQEIKELVLISSYIYHMELNRVVVKTGPEFLNHYYQCPECGEILSDYEVEEMVKPAPKPKAETAKQGAMGI